MIFSTDQIKSITDARILGAADTSLEISEISIDSRSITSPTSTLFIAIEGNRVDGHDFINHLYKIGVRAFLVARPINTYDYAGAQFFVVPDVIAGMQE